MGRLLLWVALSLVLKHQEGAAYKLVCYFTNWAHARQNSASVSPEDVDPFLCTHLIFAFASMNNNQIIAENSRDGDFAYRQFTQLKERNRELKTLLSIGGWNFGTMRFTTMLSTSINREKFIDSVISLLRTYKFDGLDLFFLYPGLRGSPMRDRRTFCFLIQELLDAFQKEALLTRRPRLLLSAAVSGVPHIIETSYNVPLLGKLLDFISVLSYDFHGSWEKFTGHNSPLYSFPEDSKSSAYAMNYWRKLGAPAEKLMMGFPTYGRTFRLLRASQNGLQAVATGPGSPGEYTKEAGILAYYEVCSFVQKATKDWIDYQYVPYAYKGNEWVGYDDIRSFHHKAMFVKEENFGGAMVWTLDMDDVNGAFCGSGHFPLLNMLNDLLVKEGREAMTPGVYGKQKNMTTIPGGGRVTPKKHTVALRGTTEVPGTKTMTSVDSKSMTTAGIAEARLRFQTESLNKKIMPPKMKAVAPEKVIMPSSMMSVTPKGKPMIVQGEHLNFEMETDPRMGRIGLHMEIENKSFSPIIQLSGHTPLAFGNPFIPTEGNHSYVNQQPFQ